MSRKELYQLLSEKNHYHYFTIARVRNVANRGEVYVDKTVEHITSACKSRDNCENRTAWVSLELNSERGSISRLEISEGIFGE